MFKGIEFLREQSRGEGSGLLRSARNDVCSAGRSMIEMLGVLAIVGVLSVGGIAGYSKAMEKFKVNKAIEQYSYLIYGLLEHLDYMRTQKSGTEFIKLAESLNLLPDSWTVTSNKFAVDDFNNNVHIFSSYEHRNSGYFVAFEIYFGQDSKKYVSNQQNKNFCRELFNNIAIPLHSSIYAAFLWKEKTTIYNGFYYGDEACQKDRKCLNHVNLNEIDRLCKTCTEDNDGSCSLILYI